MPKKKKWWWITLPIALLLLVFSLFSRDKYLLGRLPFSQPTPTVSPSPVPTVYIFSPKQPALSSSAYVEMAVKTLVERLNVNPAEIQLVNIEEHDWNNTSLGCPQPGKFYADVITPGFIIELAAEGRQYVYHAGLERIVTCENG